MKPEQYSAEYGCFSFNYTVVRRERKTLEIAVEPDSTIRVAAPKLASPERIAQKVKKRASWILQQQRYFEQFAPRTPGRRYLSGETHLYLGRQYRLKVIKAVSDSVKLLRGYIVVQTTRPEESAKTKRMVELWYARKARVRFQERIEACMQRFARPDSIMPSGVTIRTMQKRWGSMSQGRRLMLNQRLIQAPVDTIDYVITHELCHLLERDHSPRFFRLLKRVMSDWEQRKEKLEQFLS
jgi:predicted metal-dependent hydrolase